MNLEELKDIENKAYAEVKRIEIDILEPLKEKWRRAYRAVEAAEKEAAIDAEVQRRLNQQAINSKGI